MANQVRDSRSLFLCRVHPKNNSSVNNFASIARLEPSISIDMKNVVVHLFSSDPEHITIDDENQIVLLLYGEIYNGGKNNQPRYLMEQYINSGLDFVKKLDGSFVILLFDKISNIVALITDRLNSRKAFYSQYEGDYWLSNSLYIHPLHDVDLDLVGIASYLANRTIFNNRTLFDGVRVFERGCIHKIDENGFHATQYWSYEFSNAYSGTSEKTMRTELSDLLVESVRKRVSNNEKIVLALTGGYDASSILGILRYKLNIPRVDCFTLVHGEFGPGSDAYVARQLAHIAGYNHKMIQGYQGNFLECLYGNASLGNGIASYFSEFDGFFEMAKDFSITDNSVLFFGDECFGDDNVVQANWRLESKADVLKTIYICDFGVLSYLSGLLGEETYGKLHDGLYEELQNMFKRCPPSRNYHDLKHFLYLDQRMSNYMLTHREYFPGHFVTARSPFLDNAILDFMMKVPTDLRVGKRLYVRTITEMFPELFKLKRATTNRWLDWRKEFILKHSEVESLILSRNSKLDKIIPPALILQLLRQVVHSEASEPLKEDMYYKVRAILPAFAIDKINQVVSQIPRRRHRLPDIKVGCVDLLRRILYIRLFLNKTIDKLP